MTLRERAVGSVRWAVVHIWVADVVAAIGFVALSRILGAHLVGLVALALLILEFSTIVVKLGLPSSIVQRRELRPAQLVGAFWVCTLGAVLAAGCWWVGAGVAARMLGEAELEPVLAWLSLALIPAGLGSVHEALLRRRFGFRALAIQRLVSVSLGCAVGLTMALRGHGIQSAVAMYLVTAFASLATLWIACDWRPRGGPSWSETRELLTFGIPVVGSRVVAFAQRRADQILVGAFLGPAALGLYSVGRRITEMLIGLLGRSVASVALPAFSELQQDRVRLARALSTTTRAMSVFVFPIFLGLAMLAPEIVRALFGPSWADSAPILRVLAILGVAVSLGQFHRSLIVAAGRPAWTLWLATLHAFVVVAGTVSVLSLGGGLPAVAVVSAVAAFAVEPLALAVVQGLTGLDPRSYLRGFLAPAFAAVIMSLVLAVARELLPTSWTALRSLAVLVPLGALLYAGSLLLGAPRLLQQTRAQLWSVAKPNAGASGTAGESSGIGSRGGLPE